MNNSRTPESITVIIPSYNRAHLLNRTIPTYFQPGVEEIILIDDYSQDNTEEIVKELQKSIPILRYLKQPHNMKQTAAKNRGIRECGTKWIYFGDDDSILAPGTIETLYNTAILTNSEIVGARAMYMAEGEDKIPIDELIKKNTVYASSIDEIVNIETLSARFNLSFDSVIEVPFCNACILINTNLAKRVLFDEGYIGNAYREETDFIIRCSKEGAKIVYNPSGVQYNLPSSQATGGAHSSSVWKYKRDMIVNNWRFLKKNHQFMKDRYHVPHH